MSELCNMAGCATSQQDFLAEQCEATDKNPIQGERLHWIPNEGVYGKSEFVSI